MEDVGGTVNDNSFFSREKPRTIIHYFVDMLIFAAVAENKLQIMESKSISLFLNQWPKVSTL